MRIQRTMIFLGALLSLGYVAIGCSGGSACDPTGPARCAADRAAASALVGTWTQLRPADGMSLRMTLTARDTMLSGTGTFTASGAAGATQVTGFVSWRDAAASPGGMLPAEPITLLNFALENNGAAQFDQAKLFGQDTLRGALTFSGNKSTSYLVDFVRTVVP